MLLREKFLVGFCVLLFLVGVADLNTPYVNLFWEHHLGFPGRFMIIQGEKIGYVNARSRLMIPPKFDDGVSYFDQDPSPALSQGLWGFIDTTGNWTIQPQFLSAKKFTEHLASVSVRDGLILKYGFINEAGDFVISPAYAEAGSFSGGVAPVKSAGVWGYVRPSGQWAVEPKFEDAQDFSEDLAAVEINGLWGFIGQNGLFLIQPQFAEAKGFHDGRAPVKLGQRWGYIDTRGQWVVSPSYVTAGIFTDGIAVVNDSGLIDPDGKAVAATGSFGHVHDFS